MNALLPAPEAAALPAPAWLFHGLLLLTFSVHVLFMNVTLGAGLIGAVHAVGKAATDDRRAQLHAALARILPTSVSFTITTGVAPLLFVQVLYGQLFYPATILIGWAWLAIPGLLIVGYAAVYAMTGGRGRAIRWLGLSAACFLAIAVVQVTANVLQLTPARWAGVAAGATSALAEATLLPRLLHFLLGALAVGGLALAVVARAAEDDGWPGRLGARWALGATAAQMAAGFWFLFSLPPEILRALLAGRAPATPLLAVAMGLGFLTLILLARLERPARQPALLHGAAASLLLTVLTMVMLRDAVRDLYLAPVLQAPPAVRTQLDLLLVFVVVLLAGLGTLAWIGRRLVREAGSRPGAAK
ncbi:MAG: hypothetical protein ACE147_10375 [Candidatus Methylomirabilales bacterium]